MYNNAKKDNAESKQRVCGIFPPFMSWGFQVAPIPVRVSLLLRALYSTCWKESSSRRADESAHEN
jgi:hypothetical protein